VPREQLSKLGRSIQYQEGLPEEYGNAEGEPSLILLDEILNQVYGKEVCDLFTKGSHHRNISVLLLTQNIFHQGPNSRDISLNAKYLVLLKNVRDKNQFLFLARQVYSEGSHSLYDSYRDATIKPNGYLILDFAQDTRQTKVSNQCLSKRRYPHRVRPCKRRGA
jgi:CheY-like chemotaxis protein